MHNSQGVLVTGAGGSVGQYVVDESIEKFSFVIATDLPGRLPPRFIDHPGIITVEGDLTKDKDFKILEEVVLESPVEAIINTAAIVDISQPWEKLYPVNVYLVRKLFELGKKSFIGNFVHISSASIYENDKEDTFLQESASLLATSDYEESKIRSERILEGLSKDQTWIDVTVLRPSLIYGPRCRFLGASLLAIPELLSKVSSLAPSFTGGPKTNWVHCEDVARACVHCLTTPQDSTYEVYNICNKEAPTFGEVITLYLKAFGLRVIGEIPLPSPKIMRKFRSILEFDGIFDFIVNPILKSMWKYFGKPQSQLFVQVDKEAILYAFKNTLFDNSAFEKRGFRYTWNLEEGIANTMRWYKHIS